MVDCSDHSDLLCVTWSIQCHVCSSAPWKGPFNRDEQKIFVFHDIWCTINEKRCMTRFSADRIRLLALSVRTPNDYPARHNRHRKVKGRDCHGGYPDQSSRAIVYLAQVVQSTARYGRTDATSALRHHLISVTQTTTRGQKPAAPHCWRTDLTTRTAI